MANWPYPILRPKTCDRSKENDSFTCSGKSTGAATRLRCSRFMTRDVESSDNMGSWAHRLPVPVNLQERACLCLTESASGRPRAGKFTGSGESPHGGLRDVTTPAIPTRRGQVCPHRLLRRFSIAHDQLWQIYHNCSPMRARGCAADLASVPSAIGCGKFATPDRGICGFSADSQQASAHLPDADSSAIIGP